MSAAMQERKPLVLVIDDDADLRALTQMQLSEDFTVIQAGSGRAGVEAASKQAPDAILLDMMMPGMVGLEALELIVEDPVTRDIPVLFVSGMSAVEDRVRALDAGAVDFITRPADPRELIARVKVATRSRTRHEAMRAMWTGDAVTGLPGTTAFERRLEEEVARARRSGSSVAVLVADIDALRTINDEHGRSAGDDVIRTVSNAFRTSLRVSDTFYRYEDDAFAAILPDTEGSSAALAAERARRAMAVSGGRRATVSIGISDLAVGRSAEETLAGARKALAQAKESGGNRIWRADDPRRRGLSPRTLAIDLTDREWAVLTHLAEQHTEQDIARRMGIRPGTVRSHKARIRRKLHVSPDVRLSQFVRDNYADLNAGSRPREVDLTERELSH
ncbi:MAG TPA: diguanylate cyclase [Actinomycetota bacterium]|nr:diguanylate cyclase [Actinomycetota bacterium]